LVWFFVCPISPKKDTTHQVKPIVEVREYVYFLYLCILTPHDMQDVQEDAISTWVTSRPGLVPYQSLPQPLYAAL